jgi:hypothetical protein
MKMIAKVDEAHVKDGPVSLCSPTSGRKTQGKAISVSRESRRDG